MNDLTADDDILIPPDTRRHRRLLDSRIQADGELSDSDDEGTGGRKNHASQKDTDNVENSNGSGRKLLGAGIMSSSSTSAHAGPSVHTTVARVLSSTIPVSQMEVDIAESAENPPSANGDTKSLDEMVVDESTVS